MVGAVVSSTMRERKPSATNSKTLCGRLVGAARRRQYSGYRDDGRNAILAASDENRYIE